MSPSATGCSFVSNSVDWLLDPARMDNLGRRDFPVREDSLRVCGDSHRAYSVAFVVEPLSSAFCL